jgi:hypothetical protein
MVVQMHRDDKNIYPTEAALKRLSLQISLEGSLISQNFMIVTLQVSLLE